MAGALAVIRYAKIQSARPIKGSGIFNPSAHSGQSNRTRECPLLDQSRQNSILAGDGLSANDPKQSSGARKHLVEKSL
jgi:hypothetical protein